MKFTPIEKSSWPRREYFDHYLTRNPCTYSAVFKLDITRLRQSGKKLYPSMVFYLSTAVNRHEEFRMALDENGTPGYYDVVHPCCTVFHKETQTFSNLWTAYIPDYGEFCRSWERDMAAYGDCHGLMARSDTPANTFPVSMLPWAGFESFNLNLQNAYEYLAPIFTMGRYSEENGRFLLPLAVQVHHAVCDGFHLCRLVREVQELLDGQGGV